MPRLSEITVHGRFQPPVHINHWGYVKNGFEVADHVNVLITNPFGDEAFDETASWRNDPINNPFTYDERVGMFARVFTALGIEAERYDFRPFNIKDGAAFDELDPAVPNLVNVYSEWSAKKAALFKSHGLAVVQLELSEPNPVSGTMVRRTIVDHQGDPGLPDRLVEIGFLPEAVPGLMDVLAMRHQM